MRRIIKGFLSFFLSLLQIKKNSIVLIESHYPSGSNTRKLFEDLRSRGFNVETISVDNIINKEGNLKGYLKNLVYTVKVSRYEIIVCTNGFYKYNKKQKLIDLWHGIPIKSMGNMEEGSGRVKLEGSNTDYLITSSKMESSLLSACLGIPFSKHRILGSCRNDYLSQPCAGACELFNIMEKYNHVLIYMPTFREGYLNKVEGKVVKNILPFDDFNLDKLNTFLKNNNILLIVKYHPFEEKYKDIGCISDHILHLTNKVLVDNHMDLYQVLPKTDILITDYSSIYFDYLLMDKPVVFAPYDLEEYSRNRGLLLEPYHLWNPGATCVSQDKFEKVILDTLMKPDEYASERKRIKDMMHLYTNGKATERIIRLINDILGSNL